MTDAQVNASKRTANASSANRPLLRSVALPHEHGGWGFLLEPVLLGLLVAPSGAGGWLALSALGAFLTRHPLKLALNDGRRGKVYTRTRLATGFAVFYGLVALGAFGLAISSAMASFWWPLVLAVPFGLAQLFFDTRNRSRELVPEVCGALAMAFLAPAIALAAGWALAQAWPSWVILAVRAVPSILYVRARLRLECGEPIVWASSFVPHLLGFLGLGILTILGITPWLAVFAAWVLLVRSVYGLSDLRRRVPAKIVGFQEIAYGLMVVLLAASGYRFGL